MLPLSFSDFAEHAGYGLRPPARMPFDASFTAEGRSRCEASRLQPPELAGAFDAHLRVGGLPRAVIDFRATGSVFDGFMRDR